MDGRIPSRKRSAPADDPPLPSKRQQKKARWKAIGKAKQAAKKQTYKVGENIECQGRNSTWDVPEKPLVKDKHEDAIEQYEQHKQIIERGQGYYAIDNPHYIPGEESATPLYAAIRLKKQFGLEDQNRLLSEIAAIKEVIYSYPVVHTFTNTELDRHWL
jgi:hypothetical protein